MPFDLGESAENEIGGPISSLDSNVLDRRWLEEFGGLLGLRTNDMADILQIPKEKLIMYTYPTDEELKWNKRFTLGQFLPWDGHENALIAEQHGFKPYAKDVEGSIVNYENLDNVYMRIELF